ncbi:hypothetical protein L7F22_050460 [Adiantum nelumboides]|nr:hypothetical protein [Adiantum nelumboides]
MCPQTMMPNPMYGGIGLQPGFQSTHGQFGMPQASFGMAKIANQQPYMTPLGLFNSGQGTQINPNSVPMFQSLPYDNLTPLEKPTPYKEGGKGGNFKEASKVRKAATYLTGNAGQWWTTLLLQGQAPSTWIYLRQIFASAWLSDDFEADVMTEWHQLNAASCKNLDDYNRKFWKALLPVTSYRFVPLTEQIEKYCCGLPKGLRKYCTKTKVTTLTQLIEVANTGNGLLKGEDCEFNTGIKDGSAKKNSAKKYILNEVPRATQEPSKASKGAKANFISPELASRLGIRSEEIGYTVEAGLACPGYTEAVTPIIGKLRLHIQSYVDAEEFYIMPLDGCDVLLGIPWLFRVQGILDAYNKKITVQSRGKTLILDVKLKGESIPTVSASAISSVMKKHLSAYLIFAREVSDCDESNLSVLDKERSMFLQQYSDCFSDSLPSQLPPERLEDHAIDLVPGSSPPNRPSYRVSAAQPKEIMSQVEELLEKGLIQPSSSPFCSPVLLVQKKDGSWRMCIDYRALNKNTIKNRFPIPRIDDILDKLEGAAMFSRIDLKSGYHQIRIRSEDVHKTAFRTTFGLYKFLVMPFGLTNAPATFNRMMDRIFRPHQQFVGTFFDDMIVYSKNEEEHRHHLAIVFKDLRSHRLLINAKKSEFFLEEIHFL